MQSEIVDHVIGGDSALVILPTGGGKSMCFQIPSLCMDGLTIVVSPLIALMTDQVTALKELGVAAECIHSGLSVDEKRGINTMIQDGTLKMLYMAPESLLQERFFKFITTIKISLIAIDESFARACGSDWLTSYIRFALEATTLPSTRSNSNCCNANLIAS